MRNGQYDLHLHTTASDGVLTPSELVRTAKDAGLAGIAVTDHDTAEGISEALLEGHGQGIAVIPGVELSTEPDEGKDEIHILGLLFDMDSEPLREFLRLCRESRSNRISRMVDKLRQNGYGIELSRVLEIAGEGSIGRPHIAEALMEKGYVSSRSEAFERLIGPGGAGYVPRMKVTPEEGVEMIVRARGIPVLAHPGIYLPEGLLTRLMEKGLEGIEVYHSSHSVADEERFLAMAERNGLLVTGGSDSHGPGAKEEAEIGCRTVDEERVRRLIGRRTELYGPYPGVDSFV